MVLGQRNPLRRKLWVLLVLAFTMVASVATTISLLVAQVSLASSAEARLTNLARVVASQVDARAHSQLDFIGQNHSPEFRELRRQLNASIIKIPQVQRFFTVRMTSRGPVYVIDSTTPGHVNQQNVDDHRYLMQPANDLPSTARAVLSEGGERVDPDSYREEGTRVATVYAAIYDESGKVVGALGLICEAPSPSLVNDQPVRLLWRLGSVLFLCVGFAWMLSRQLVPDDTGGARPKLPWASQSWRVHALEILLASILGFVFLSSAQVLLLQSETDQHLTDSRKQTANLDRLRSAIEQDFLSNRTEPTEAREVARQVFPQWGRMDLQTMLRQVMAALGSESSAREELQEQSNVRGRRLSIVYLVACIMTIGTLGVLRVAARQEAALIAAESESRRHQAAYYQVAQSLPIGFFTFADGQILFANHAWDEMTHGEEDVSRVEAFTQALHPSDRASTLAALGAAWGEAKPFQLLYRVVAPNGSVRHIDSRGIPIESPEGRLEHLLGFGIDVSELVAAQREVENRNTEIRSTNKLLRLAVANLEDNFKAMAASLVKAVEAKDPYTAGHSSRVMAYSVRIGQALGLSTDEIRALEMGALMHDIGKIGVPDVILTKPSSLTAQEFACIRVHPVTGAHMIEGIPMFAPCLSIVRSHHERLNGTGYPDGLTGDEIPLLVRIVSVADCFDAMTSTRAYRTGRSAGEAIEELRKDAVLGALDLEIVNVLTEIVQREGLLWNASTDQAA